MITNKTLVAITFLAASFSGSVFANEADYSKFDNGFVSSKTREEVKSEISQARKDNHLPSANDISTYEESKFVSYKSRKEVQGEYLEAKQNGSFLKANEFYPDSH
jgi:EAL domain-containing protein (putative c-di-GMP-specific phosphodiesterase class I)